MSRSRDVDRTPDGRYLVIDGRRWRAADPELPDDLRASLQSALGRARSAVRTADDAARPGARRRVQLAKEGLGERGDPWWELGRAERVSRARQRLAAIVELEESAGR